MNALRRKAVIVLLILSWYGFLCLTGERQPWRPEKNAAALEAVRTLDLGDVPIYHYGRMGFTRASLEFIDGETKGWAIGTERGEVWLLDYMGNVRWKRSLGIGKVSFLRCNKAGTLIFVGEQSPSGNVYALERESGKIIWSYSTAAGVGSAPNIRSYPTVNHIAVDDENIYVSAYRSGSNGKNSIYIGRVFSLTAQGALRWQFPADEFMDTWAGWIAEMPKQNQLALCTANYNVRTNLQYPDSMYFLNKQNGGQVATLDIPVEEPYKWVAVRGGPNFSSDGHAFTVITNDGRGFLFSQDRKQLWQRRVITSRQIDGAWINSSGRLSYIIGDKVVFATAGTFNGENWQLPTPVEHPAAGHLIVFDQAGRFLYSWRAGGNIEDMAYTGELMAFAIGRNLQTKQYSVHGLGVLSVKTGEEIQRFSTHGPCQAVAISSDGRKAAAVEAPAALPNGEIIGAYRLHIWDVSEAM